MTTEDQPRVGYVLMVVSPDGVCSYMGRDWKKRGAWQLVPLLTLPEVLTMKKFAWPKLKAQARILGIPK
jgi:hypothetical protein